MSHHNAVHKSMWQTFLPSPAKFRVQTPGHIAHTQKTHWVLLEKPTLKIHHPNFSSILVSCANSNE